MDPTTGGQEIPVSQVPSADDLKRLPLRALVAFATRCALRARPLFVLPTGHPEFEKHALAVDTAIAATQDLIMGGKGDDSQEALAVAMAAQEAANTAQAAHFSHAALAAQTAALAAAAARAAATNFGSSNDIFFEAFDLARELARDGVDFNKAVPLTRGDQVIRYVAGAAGTAANALELVYPRIQDDYDSLFRIAQGTYMVLGDPIHPEDSGPLGPLWPNGAPTWYTVDGSHPFFDEILLFHTSVLTFMPLVLWPQIEPKLGETQVGLTALGQSTPESEERIVAINTMLSRLPRAQCFADWVSPRELIFSPAGAVAKLLDSSVQLPYLVFALQPWDIALAGKGAGTGGDMDLLQRSLDALACHLVGGAYEKVKDTLIVSKYPGSYRRWPAELQFFRHLRNGCFHGNNFRIDPEWRGRRPHRTAVDQIDTLNPPQWQSYQMPSDAAMNSKGKAMNGWFRLPDLLPFLYDIGELLR